MSGSVITTNIDGISPTYTENDYQQVSLDSLVFTDQVDGNTLNSNIWANSVLTQTITQASGFILLNAGLSVVINTYAILQSIKSIPLYGHLPLVVFIRGKVNITPIANATIEVGLGVATTTAAPTDGAFFRWAPDGTFRCVINNTGVETSAIVFPPPSITIEHIYQISVVEDLVQFFIDDVVVAEVAVPSSQSYPFNGGRQTVFARTFNGAVSPATAPQFGVGQVNVVQQDLNQNKLWKEVLVSLGRGSYQSPIAAFGQTANHANSTDPVAATLLNTAAGYTTLGGRWSFAAVAGAVTDYALFGFQVPAGFQLNISSVTISSVNTGAIGSAVTPTILDWSVGVNSSAVSLATVDGVGTTAPRRVPLGLQSFPISAAIGAAANDIVRVFDPPLIVDGGRFVHIILEVPVGAATATEVIRGDVVINGYYE